MGGLQRDPVRRASSIKVNLNVLRFFKNKIIFNLIKSSKHSSKFFTKNINLSRSSRVVLHIRGVSWGSSREKTGSRRRNVIKEDISGGPWGYSWWGPWWGSFLVVLGSQRVSTRGSILGVSAQALTKASK